MRKQSLFRLLFAPLFGITLFGGAACSSFEEHFEDNTVFDMQIATYQYASAAYTADGEYIPLQALRISYYDDSIDISDYVFYFWANGVNGITIPTTTSNEHEINAFIDFAEYPELSEHQYLYFLAKPRTSWVGQTNDCLIDLFEYYDYYDRDNILTLYCYSDLDGTVELSTDDLFKEARIYKALFTDWKTIHVEAKANEFISYSLFAFEKTFLSMSPSAQKANKALFKVASGTPTKVGELYSFDIVSQRNVPINAIYQLELKHSSGRTFVKRVSFDKLYETPMFKKHYTYTGEDLGVTYSNESTTFKVWAPTAGLMSLNIYYNYISNSCASYRMSYLYGGVWACTINGDLQGVSYTYTVNNSNGEKTTIDPYVKACTQNGERGVVVDFSQTSPYGWDMIPLKWDGVSGKDISTPQELTIYETHIRDLTMHETWQGENKRGTFKAFIEKGTTYSKGSDKVTTGFDHIEEMGVNAVQLLPVFDYDNDESPEKMNYNWGYNPLNYNCVEGGYSSDSFDPLARITEFKELVQAFANNKNNTRIIMDVVYNHVSSARYSSFEKLMPHYYFRLDSNGIYYDGSGCGNEVKSEAPMMSKFIVDSLKWWASEYKIKGFRFDLMGLIDQKTMIAAAQELYKIDPDIYLYGEGWGAGMTANIDTTIYQGYYASTTNNTYSLLKKNGEMCYIGCFNDGGRNALKGDNYNFYDLEHLYPGYGFLSQGSDDVSNKSTLVGEMLLGRNTSSTISNQSPLQTINYASCHDNYTLFDHFSYALRDSGLWNSSRLNDVLRAATISNITIMMSNGVPFMMGGEELFRTKRLTSDEDISRGFYEEINDYKVSYNSYNLSDSVNALDWSRKIEVEYLGDTISTKAFVKSLQDVIKLRKDFKFKANTINEGHPCNYWDAGDGCTKLAWFFESKTGSNNTMGYKLCISGRYGYPNSVYNGDSSLITAVGQYTLQTNLGDGSKNAVSMGMYACVVTRTSN